MIQVYLTDFTNHNLYLGGAHFVCHFLAIFFFQMVHQVVQSTGWICLGTQVERKNRSGLIPNAVDSQMFRGKPAM